MQTNKIDCCKDVFVITCNYSEKSERIFESGSESFYIFIEEQEDCLCELEWVMTYTNLLKIEN